LFQRSELCIAVPGPFLCDSLLPKRLELTELCGILRLLLVTTRLCIRCKPLGERRGWGRSLSWWRGESNGGVETAANAHSCGGLRVPWLIEQVIGSHWEVCSGWR
jgi:hypothetical protein